MYDGDQVVDAFSRIGRTYVLNTRIKLEVFLDRKLRLIVGWLLEPYY